MSLLKARVPRAALIILLVLLLVGAAVAGVFVWQRLSRPLNFTEGSTYIACRRGAGWDG